MNINKLVPWNWFKKEQEMKGISVPVKHNSPVMNANHPLAELYQEMDSMMENLMQHFGLTPALSPWKPAWHSQGKYWLRPQVDISATEKEYAVNVELPGVSEKDVQVEVDGDTLRIRGEKRQDKETRERDYYAVERSYGSFQRVLTLPEDANAEQAQATFKNGVMAIRMPRKALPHYQARRIEVKAS